MEIFGNVGNLIDLKGFRAQREVRDTSKILRKTLNGESLIVCDFVKMNKWLDFIQSILENQQIELKQDYIRNKYKLNGANIWTIELNRLYNEGAIYEFELIRSIHDFDMFFLSANSIIYYNAPEITNLMLAAKEEQKPVITPFVSPLSPEVLKLTKISIWDALQAIMINEKAKYGTNDRRLLMYLSNKYNINTEVFEYIEKIVLKKIEEGDDYIYFCIILYNHLIDIANTVNYYKIKDLKLEGNILMIEELSLVKVLSKDFKPNSSVNPANIPNVNNKRVSSYGNRTFDDSLKFLLGYEKFEEEYGKISSYLSGFNWNEFMFRRIERILFKHYQFFRNEYQYKQMLKIAELMKKYGIEGAEKCTEEAEEGIQNNLR